ncbi:hypothetical protein OE88DRAFT_1735200 [Heliocybe sulcata]|uniref:Uncharacterized protein n=1 Tax=Heliocybe sulcata TaxID=5364 RepID=A0A5C3NBM9_9AGAM|nr:hypothetical protein OE88DRAFT_1735200 [Heliocybe sulcata]
MPDPAPPSTLIEKTLVFHYKDFPDDAQLMLTFSDPDPSKVGSEQAAVAWKVVDILGKQIGVGDPVKFTSQLAFGITGLGHDNVVTSNVAAKIAPGQNVAVNLKNDHAIFDTPTTVPSQKEIVSCENKTGRKQTLSVGFFAGNDYNPTYIWENVGASSSVTARYHPILKAYITSNMKQGQFLTAGLVTKDPIWQKNLVNLSNNTQWDIIVNPDTGAYSIDEHK